MFSSTLKLFSQVPCPDDQCLRSPCLFSHNIQHKTVAPEPPIANPSAPSRAPAVKPSNLFIPGNNAKQNGTRPQPISRTPRSVDKSIPDAAPTITGFDMARGLVAQSARPASANSSRSTLKPSSAPYAPGVPLQTKTLSSGMIKRPNKISKPTAVSSPVYYHSVMGLTFAL